MASNAIWIRLSRVVICKQMVDDSFRNFGDGLRIWIVSGTFCESLRNIRTAGDSSWFVFFFIGILMCDGCDFCEEFYRE